MKLKDYIKSKNLTIKEFCKIHGFNYGSFRIFLAGKYRPSPEMALKIEKATGGRVKRLELLYPNNVNKKITNNQQNGEENAFMNYESDHSGPMSER